MTQLLLFYFVVINLVTLVVSIIDKACAVHQVRRVPEAFLLALSWAGGAAAAKFAQIISGHKTLKFGFSATLNLIVIFQFSVVLAIWSYQHTANLQHQNITAFEAWMGKPDKPDRPKRFGPGTR